LENLIKELQALIIEWGGFLKQIRIIRTLRSVYLI
jgi:hypothetical protein